MAFGGASFQNLRSVWLFVGVGSAIGFDYFGGYQLWFLIAGIAAAALAVGAHFVIQRSRLAHSDLGVVRVDEARPLSRSVGEASSNAPAPFQEREWTTVNWLRDPNASTTFHTRLQLVKLWQHTQDPEYVASIGHMNQRFLQHYWKKVLSQSSAELIAPRSKPPTAAGIVRFKASGGRLEIIVGTGTDIEIRSEEKEPTVADDGSSKQARMLH